MPTTQCCRYTASADTHAMRKAQSLIQNRMRLERSECAGKRRIALYRKDHSLTQSPCVLHGGGEEKVSASSSASASASWQEADRVAPLEWNTSEKTVPVACDLLIFREIPFIKPQNDT